MYGNEKNIYVYTRARVIQGGKQRRETVEDNEEGNKEGDREGNGEGNRGYVDRWMGR